MKTSHVAVAAASQSKRFFSVRKLNKVNGFCSNKHLKKMEALKEYVMIERTNEFASDCSGRDHALPSPQQGGPCLAARALAIAQIAMADAYNSIENKFARYTSMPSYTGGDKLAAVAQAAHDTLIVLFSQQETLIESALEGWLATIPEGTAKTIGIAAGKKAAQLILAARTNDGAYGTNGTAPPTNTTTNPGQWSQAPPESNAAGSTAYGATFGTSCKPFIVNDTAEIISLFRAPPPPALTSNEYLAAFNQEKSVGGVGDATSPSARTQDQYELAIFWGYDGTRQLCAPPTLYFAITRQIFTQHQKTGAELMRALALVAVAMAEAGIAAWESKYYYNHWRPITAIRYTGAGVHPGAIPQADWLCLGAPASNVSNGGKNFTPPFCGYVSGHATFGGSLFGVIRLLFGTDDVPFTFCSRELDGITRNNLDVARPFKPRSYLRLSQAEMENGDSRIFLGIHWCYDRDEGIKMGNKIAVQALDRIFQLIE